jgi:DNA segregation ATPase FtsK/SpoIIIE-like protein
VRQSSGIFMYIALGMMVMAAGAMMIGQVMRKAGDRKQRLRGERRDYLRYLAQSRRTVQRAVIEQQLALAWRHPEPRVLRTMVRTTRLWERRVKDEDFGEVRIAVGDQQLAMRLTPVSSKPVEDLEPLCAHALRRFIRAYSTVPGQPIALYLRSWSRVLVHGDHDAARGMLRAALAQLALFHPPEELWIAVCAADEVRAEWEWVKWLPHNQHPQETDGAGPLRMVASAFTDLEDQLGSEFSERPAFDPDAVPGRDEPLVVVIVDGAAIPAGHRFDGPGSATPSSRPLRQPHLAPRPHHAAPRRLPGRGRAGAHRPQPQGAVHRAGPPRPGGSGRRRGAGPADRAVPDDALLGRGRTAVERHGVDHPARHRRPAPARPRHDLAAAHRLRPGCASRSPSARTAGPWSWTSRSPRRAAWARTAC